MHVNNETGAITDIKAAVKAVKAINPKALVMSDGVQAFMKLPVNVEDSGVDMYSISAHKIHAPKGVGALWVKKELTFVLWFSEEGRKEGFAEERRTLRE